jgi:hypothetical protein
MPRNLVEGSAGLRIEMSPVSVATVSGNVGSQNGVTYGGQVGYSHAF